MLSSLDSRVGLLADQLRPEFRGAPKKEVVREPSIDEVLLTLETEPEELSGVAGIPCLLRGYDKDCQFALNCDHTRKSCEWLAVLAES